MSRALILVTGAPRTATTPVGNMLASARKTASLYEPLGPTGLKRFQMWFPMAGDPGAQQIDALIDDLRHLRTGGLKSQQRDGGFSVKRAILGSRTLHSYRLARLQVGADHLIWKDPHAIFLAPDIAKRGVPVVLTVREARAHAASYRRLGWVSKAGELYPRWCARFGRCDIIERFLPDAGQAVTSAALLWRMCYLPLLQEEVLGRVHLVTPDALMRDEHGCYAELFGKLGLVQSAKTRAMLQAPKSDAGSRPSRATTHDWGRSVAAVNSYWREILTADDLARVHEITCDIEEQILTSTSGTERC